MWIRLGSPSASPSEPWLFMSNMSIQIMLIFLYLECSLIDVCVRVCCSVIVIGLC